MPDRFAPDALFPGTRLSSRSIWLAILSLLFGVGSIVSVSAQVVRRSAACSLHQVAVDDGKLTYRSCGTGAAVILLPGGPGLDAEYMLAVATAVTADGRQAVLIEQRGTGRSRSAIGDGRHLTVVGSVEDVDAVRRDLDVAHVTLVGHSFGGAIAQAYAAAHPDHVDRLVLMDSVGPNLQPSKTPLDSWRSRLPRAELAAFDAARARGDRLAAMKIKFLGSFYHRRRGLTFVRNLKDAEFHPDVAPLADDYARNFDVKVSAGRVHFPVIIMSGEIDWIRGYEPALRAAYANSRLILIPHAGHFPWVDAPKATRRALRSALRD
jgi:proline iminopeptidase